MIVVFASVLACVTTGGTAWGYFSAATPTQTNTFVAGQISPAANFTASSVTSSSVSLAWTAPTEPAGATITNWTITQSPAGGTGCGGSQPANPCSVTGLASSTAYTWTLAYFVGGWQALTTTTATTSASGGTFGTISSPLCTTNSINNAIVNYPSGTASGDLVLLMVANNAQQSADFAAGGNSTGWTAVSTAAGYPPNQNGSIGQQELQVFWHIAGTETSVNFRLLTNSRGGCGWVIDYKNVPSPALTGTTVFGTADNTASLTQAAFTTTAPNSLVISFAEITASTPAAPTLGTANGYTSRFATTALPNVGMGLSIADRVVGTAGSVTAPVWTEAANSQWAYITVAFT